VCHSEKLLGSCKTETSAGTVNLYVLLLLTLKIPLRKEIIQMTG
jgi:hypothetical protein